MAGKLTLPYLMLSESIHTGMNLVDTPRYIYTYIMLVYIKFCIFLLKTLDKKVMNVNFIFLPYIFYIKLDIQ